MFIATPPGIVYEGETPEQAAERDRKIAEHNRRWQEEIDKWGGSDPASLYRQWYLNKFGVEYGE